MSRTKYKYQEKVWFFSENVWTCLYGFGVNRFLMQLFNTWSFSFFVGEAIGMSVTELKAISRVNQNHYDVRILFRRLEKETA